MLQLQHCTFVTRKEQRRILEDFSYTVRPGERTVLIGEEGNGKSSLLKYFYDPALVEGYMDVQGKRIVQGERLAYLPQSVSDQDRRKSVYEFFLEEPGFVQADPRELSRLALAMGLPVDFWYGDQAFGSLSGGEQVKAQLARIRLMAPTISLLDEPSNNLDLEVLKWLEKEILEMPGAVLFVSHDEQLIRHTADGIIHIELLNRKTASRVHVEHVPYGQYLEHRAQRLANETAKALSDKKRDEMHAEKLNRIESSVHYDLNHVSRQDPHTGQLLKKKMHTVKAMEKRFEKERASSTPMPQTEEAIVTALDQGYIPAGRRVLSLHLEELKNPAGAVLAAPVDLEIYGPQKIAIIGRNGAGKSTLLHQIRDMLAKTDLRVGYMPQNYEEVLPMDKTPVAFLAPAGDRDSITRARAWLGAMRYTSEEMIHAVRELSGGQQGKLLFLKMALDGDDVLLLDEPTRNFSPLSQPVIDEALAAFHGCLLSISHDRVYLAKVPDRILELTRQGLAERKKEDVLGG